MTVKADMAMSHTREMGLQGTAEQSPATRVACRLATKMALGLLLALPVCVHSQQYFTDATGSAGIAYSGESWGASWGDYNGDGWPDLFINRHRSRPAMLLNITDGSFQDRGYEIAIWNQFPFRDQHGGAWGDWDNDDDQDLMISMGSKDPTQFLVNLNGTLTDQISLFNIDAVPPAPRWQGRMPMWFDFSGDGLLDFAMSTSGGRFQLFRQSAGNFVKANSVSGNQCSDGQYGQLVDITDDGRLDWLCAIQSQFPDRVYDTRPFEVSGAAFSDVTALIPKIPNVIDSAFADFDGDLDPDLLAITGRARVSGSEITGPNSIQSHLVSDNGEERGVSFQSGGDVTFVIYWSKRNITNVRIGGNGWNPPSSPPGEPFTFTLSPNDPNVVGIQAHGSTATAIYIGYDPATQTWTMLSASGTTTAGGEGEWSYVYTFIDSTEPVSNVVNIGLSAPDRPSAPVYLRNDAGPGNFVNATVAAGLNTAIPCVAVAAADFDNDMDVDAYVICRNAVSNAPDRLYLNNGAGVFTLVPDAGGAAGPSGPGAGLGENVVVSDYDVDGFIDVFQTNGMALYPENPYSVGGPDKLYRNVGNSNNWIELDLVGTNSNRDAVGAVVTATAGGIAQRRWQDGGYHRWAQNDKRIHFGLGGNDTVSIEVVWPNGVVRNFPDVPANALYRVSEDGTIEEVELRPEPPPSPCGAPVFDRATEQGVFIWRDCPSDNWHVRVGGGGAGTITYVGNVSSLQPLQAVTGFSIETSDVFDVSDPNRINYILKVSGASLDGFNFTLAGGGCFDFDAPANLPVVLGVARTVMPPTFDLTTFGACAGLLPSVSIANVSVPENVAGGLASLAVTLSEASTQAVTVQFATSDGTAVAPDDYASTSDVVTFMPGETSQTIEIPIVDDLVSEGLESFNVTLTDPDNAVLGDAVGTATIVDDEVSACGAPTIDRATERAAFIWRECPSNKWKVQFTNGGFPTASTFVGAFRSNQVLGSVVGFSIELPSDVLDATTDPTRVSYSLRVSSPSVDGFDVTPADGSTSCFALDLPADVPVLIGQAKSPGLRSFDVNTLAACPL